MVREQLLKSEQDEHRSHMMSKGQVPNREKLLSMVMAKKGDA